MTLEQMENRWVMLNEQVQTLKSEADWAAREGRFDYESMCLRDLAYVRTERDYYYRLWQQEKGAAH